MTDWKSTLADKTHPIWRVLSALVAIGGMYAMARHGSIHLEDAAGVGGSAIGGFLLRGLLGKDT